MAQEETRAVEFFTRVLDTEAFRFVCGPGFNSSGVSRLAKPMVIRMFGSILGPNFDPVIRRRCLEAASDVCCKLFLRHNGLSTDTNIDSFMRSLEGTGEGLRKLEKTGSVIVDDIKRPDGQCACPIVRGDGISDASLMCDGCCRNVRTLLFAAVAKRPVSAEPLDTPLLTGSDSCRWLIKLL